MAARAAIVGGAATTALGDDLATTLDALWAGRTALRPWPGERAWDGRPPWAARLPDEAPSGEADPVRRMQGRHGAWLERCARAAHAEGGLAALPREDVGLFVGLGMVDPLPEDLAAAVLSARGADGALDAGRFFAEGWRAIHPLWPLSMLANVAAGHVAIALDLRGDNVVLASDAGAGARALAEASRALALASARAVLAGGAAEPVDERSLLRRELRGTLARPPREPWQGLAPGEGAAVLALEQPASAAARGARVLGWLSGHGTAFGGPEATDACVREAAGLAAAAADVALEDLDLLFWGYPVLPGGRTVLLPEGAPAAWLAGHGNRRVVSAHGAVGDLGPAAATFDVLLALACFERGGVPPGWCVGFETVGRPRPEPLAPRRALVVAPSGEGATVALVVEAPSCAS